MSDGGRTPRQGAPGHERRDINARGVMLLALVLVVLVAAAGLAMDILFDYFAAREASRQPRPATETARPEIRFPPEPRLQVKERDDLADLHAAEDAVLGGYGWTDRDKGLVRIPIDRAMDLVVERGLPVRKEGAAP